MIRYIGEQGENATVYLWSFCDRKADCENEKDEEKCLDKFRCPSGDFISIENFQKCDGLVNCDDGSDESRENCPDRFFCSTLKNTTVKLTFIL